MNGGRATVFAYGQTGSGKTFTMQGIQSYVADDLFALLEHYEKELGIQVQVQVSYFEVSPLINKPIIPCCDLTNDKLNNSPPLSTSPSDLRGSLPGSAE